MIPSASRQKAANMIINIAIEGGQHRIDSGGDLSAWIVGGGSMRSRSGSGAAAEAGPDLRHETKSLSHAESAFGGGGISSRSGTASGSASGAGAGAGRARRSSSRTSVELLPSAKFNTISLERPGAGIGRRFCEVTACRLRTARSTRRSTARVPCLGTGGLGDW